MIQEKYRPTALSELNRIPAAKILSILPLDTLSNLILVGPEGAGKRTLFSAFIRDTFHTEPVFFSYTSSYEVSSSKTVEVEFLESKEVLEIRIDGLGTYDKKVLQKVAMDISATKSIKSLLRTENQNNSYSANRNSSERNPKILLISDGDLLSKGAQMALRRILEKGASNFRLVIMCSSLSHFIPAFKSRFLVCRVPGPSDRLLAEIVADVLEKERAEIAEGTTERIVSMANGNIRKALSLLELSIHTEEIKQTPWDKTIEGIARDIRINPSIPSLIKARASIYEILSNFIPSSYIITSILEELLRKEKTVRIARKVSEIASKYSARMGEGTKDLFHIEAFVAGTMSLYNDTQNQS